MEISPPTTDPTDGEQLCSAPLEYSISNGICQMELEDILISSNCSSDLGAGILVERNEEAMAMQLITGLISIGPSAECLAKAVPFLCHFLFGLCGEPGLPILPTICQCEEVRDTLCPQQWAFLIQLGVNVPDCSLFPMNTSTCGALNTSLLTDGTTMLG